MANAAELIAGHPLFDGLSLQDHDEIAGRLACVFLKSGELLFEEGDPADALYIVASGAIGVSIRDAQGRPRRIARIFPPETIGEMAVVSRGTHRSGSAVALRDATLLKLSREAFEHLVERRPAAMVYVARLLSDRLRRATAAFSPAHSSKAFAVLPVTEGVSTTAFAQDLARAMRRLHQRVGCLDAPSDGEDEASLDRFEADHDVILYVADAPSSEWTDLCLRRVDHLLLLAKPDETPLPGLAALNAPIPDTDWRRRDLILLQTDAARPAPVHDAIERLPVDLRLHARDGHGEDLARIARIVCGRALGLVLAGGGARGFAHIGVLRALAAHGLTIDLVGGASIGGVIGAGIAMGWDIAEMRRRIFEAFVETSPLNDFTLPFVALLRGREVDRRLERHFGETRIEDLRLPFFCVSSNLTSGATKVHARGLLRRALRAGIAIPGLLPPIVDEDGVLVDGAVMNNLPADVMAALQRGPILGVDAARDEALRPMASESGLTRFVRRVVGVPDETPTIVNLLFRAATAPGEAQTALARAYADVILHPPLADVDLRDWRSFDRIMEIGYASAMRSIEEGALEELGRSFDKKV